mmetsp:Transcript_22979/g.34864  ORF Transcript_22979/g.34864 Transcript_22979/m.34864 type:complete len:371 (-) Transcript_22979:1102-2214(-)
MFNDLIMISKKKLIFSAFALFCGVTSSSAKTAKCEAAIVSTGLQNLGNTCYMNAQLECAFHIPQVRQIIEKNGETSQGGHALKSLFVDMELRATSGGVASSPIELCRRLGIPVMEQQDSQEFWKLLLPEIDIPELTDLYQGSFEDYIAAVDGTKRERRREEPFLDLSLEVASGSVHESMARMFGTPELLCEKEGNGWRPEKGADKVDALKGQLLQIQGLPSLLQLHLKRFQYDWQYDKMSKLNTRFSFPARLNLAEICSGIVTEEEKMSAMYELQSVVVHVGEYGSGHYYAYVRPNLFHNKWYRFDDDRVTPVSFRDVIEDAYGGEKCSNKSKQSRLLPRLLSHLGWGGRTSSAYMLQYVRRSDVEKLYC